MVPVFYFFIYNPVFAAPVADHTSIIQFTSLTDSQINMAKSLRVLFEHRSVGEGISSGLDCLQGTNDYYLSDLSCINYPDYKYDRRNWNWPLIDAADVPAKLQAFESDVNAYANNYDVFGMKFCFIDWWYQDFNTYRDMMLRLENTYPNKKFIWASQVLWHDWNNSPDPGAIKSFNDQIRSYAVANNKIFYDLADIESYSASGSHCTQNLGGVNYEIICPDWAIPGDAHPSAEGGVRLAKGFWWLMANLSGTGPTPTSGPSPTPSKTPTPTPSRTPTPTPGPTFTPTPIPPTPTPTIHCLPLGDINCDGRINQSDLISQILNYSISNIASDLDNSGKVNMFDIVTLLKNYGFIAPTATPTPVVNQTINFDSYSGSTLLFGEYPSGVINWGNGVWSYDQGMWPPTNGCTRSIWFTQGGVTSVPFNFVSPHVLVSLTACNGGAASSNITVSCSGNTTASLTVPANSVQTLITNWLNACSQVTVTSSNSGDTNFDNFVYR